MVRSGAGAGGRPQALWSCRLPDGGPWLGAPTRDKGRADIVVDLETTVVADEVVENGTRPTLIGALIGGGSGVLLGAIVGLIVGATTSQSAPDDAGLGAVFYAMATGVRMLTGAGIGAGVGLVVGGVTGGGIGYSRRERFVDTRIISTLVIQDKFDQMLLERVIESAESREAGYDETPALLVGSVLVEHNLEVLRTLETDGKDLLDTLLWKNPPSQN